MDENMVKVKENLTFYRRMANTNITIMKKYKSAVVNKMSHKNILDIYINNNISFKDDVERLKLFFNKLKNNKTNMTLSKQENPTSSNHELEPIEINSETSDCSEPTDINSDTYIENYENKSNIYSTMKSKINKNVYDAYEIIMNNISNYTNNIYLDKNYLIPVLISSVLISSIMYARGSQK